MASKENQLILDKIKKELLEVENYKTDISKDIVVNMFDVLQQSLDRLEIVEKALDIISKQYSGYIKEICNLSSKFDISDLLKAGALKESWKNDE